MPKKIGILGGTFDPVHNGHLEIAATALKQLALDELQFIPCNIPAHKNTPHASAEQRLAMVRLAINGRPNYRVNPIELDRPKVSYSITTLVALKKSRQKLYFIIGADGYLSFKTWNRWREFTNYCTLVVYNRPGYTLPNALENATLLTMPPCTFSATNIREKISAKQDLSAELPTAVWEYIQKEKLYKEKNN